MAMNDEYDDQQREVSQHDSIMAARSGDAWQIFVRQKSSAELLMLTLGNECLRNFARDLIKMSKSRCDPYESQQLHIDSRGSYRNVYPRPDLVTYLAAIVVLGLLALAMYFT